MFEPATRHSCRCLKEGAVPERSAVADVYKSIHHLTVISQSSSSDIEALASYYRNVALCV